MGDRVMIDSGILEDKIWSTYENLKLLDELYQKLLLLQEADTGNEMPELREMLRKVQQMRRTTEDVHKQLKSFTVSIENTMRRNEEELSELQDIVRLQFR